VDLSTATICRDLADTYSKWKQQFGSEYDANRELGEAIALYQLLEGAAIRELIRLDARQEDHTSAKIRCISAAASARTARIDLLAGVGLIGPVSAPKGLPSAASIRLSMQTARMEDRALVSKAELRSGRPIIKT
jgi:hypothetical protein